MVGCGGLALVMVIVLGVLIFHFYRTIKAGGIHDLATRFGAPSKVVTTGFTPASGGGTNVQSNPVDRAPLEDGDYPTIGTNQPELTVVEFVDFKCPNCQAAAPILRQLIVEYGGKVKIISRNAPFESLHPGATRFAQIAWCAKAQGRYWAVHDYFFAEQTNLPVELSPQELGTLSDRFGLDRQKFSDCLSDQRSLIAINKEYIEALALGVRGTPTFFINGLKVEGVVPLSAWEELLRPKKN